MEREEYLKHIKEEMTKKTVARESREVTDVSVYRSSGKLEEMKWVCLNMYGMTEEEFNDFCKQMYLENLDEKCAEIKADLKRKSEQRGMYFGLPAFLKGVTLRECKESNAPNAVVLGEAGKGKKIQNRESLA